MSPSSESCSTSFVVVVSSVARVAAVVEVAVVAGVFIIGRICWGVNS